MKIIIKKDWWLVNSIICFIEGIFASISSYRMNFLASVILIAGVTILFSIAFLLRSKLAFWLVFLASIYSLVVNILRLNSTVTLISTGLSIINFIFLFMLWRQIRKEG